MSKNQKMITALATTTGAALLTGGIIATTHATTTNTTAPTPELFTVGYVLENEDHGPEWCTGAKMVRPPKCSGTPITNWSWDSIDFEESVDGTTWAEDVVLIGTWADGKLTLTQKPVADVDYTGVRPNPLPDAYASPAPGCTAFCQTWAKRYFPTWRTNSFEIAFAASNHPERKPGYTQDGTPHAPAIPEVVAAWSTPLNPKTGATVDNYADGDNYGVATVSVSGDLESARKKIAKVYSGPLCVVPAQTTYSELKTIHDEIVDVIENEPTLVHYQATSVGLRYGKIHLSVMFDDGTVQEFLDQKYGAGVVEVTSESLRPLPITK